MLMLMEALHKESPGCLMGRTAMSCVKGMPGIHITARNL